MGIGVELWRARIGLFNGGRGGRPRKASLAHQKLQCDVTIIVTNVLWTQHSTLQAKDTTSHRDKCVVESVLNNATDRTPPSNCCYEDVIPEMKKESLTSTTNHSRNHSLSVCIGLTLILIGAILVFVSLLLLLAGDVELNPGPGLDTVLTISDILEVYEKVRSASSNWFNLGLALELSYTDLTNFRDTYRGDNDVCLREALARRLQSGGPLTWLGMCTALRHSAVARNDVAVEIEDILVPIRERTELEKTQRTMESETSDGTIKEVVLMLPSTEELEADSMKMEHQFNKLVSQLCQSLEIQRIVKQSTKETLVASLMGFNSLKKVFGRRNQCVFRTQRKKLDKCSTIADIWRIIADYFSFFDYEIVEQITDSLGTAEDKEKMKLYKANFIKYAKRRLVKGKISSDSREDTVTMIVKLDSSYDNCEMSRLKLFEWNLSSILNLNDGVLKLCKIDDGCIELTFLLPSFITSDIFPLQSDQERALHSQGVLQLHCGDVYYPSEFRSDKGDNTSCSSSDSDEGLSSTLHSEYKSVATDYLETFQMHRFLEGPTVNEKGEGSNSDSGIVRSKRGARTIKSYLTEVDTFGAGNEEMLQDFNADLSALKLQSNEPPPSVKVASIKVHSAAFNGERTKLRFLVEVFRCSPLAVNRKGNTALHTAAATGDVISLKYMIEDRLVNAATESINGETPLHHAAFNGHLNIVTYLVGTQQVDPLVLDNYLYSPLHESCRGGDLNTIKYLMYESQQHQPVDVNEQTAGGWTMLHCAAFSGNSELISYLLTGNLLQGDTPSQGHCDVNCQSENGIIPLMVAAQEGHLSVVELLVSKGAQLNSQNKLLKKVISVL